MIHVLCLNPALDHLVALDDLVLNGVNRASRVKTTPGGKGINVARAIRTVGGHSLLQVFLGGKTGLRIEESLIREDLTCRVWPVEGETRITTVIHEDTVKRHTVINEPGPPVSLAQVQRFYRYLQQTLSAGDYLILSGSLSPGQRQDLYGILIQMAHARQVHTVLDSSGQAFASAYQFAPFMIKPNVEEAQQALGFSISTVEDKVRAVQVFQKNNISLVVLSDGSRGLVVGWKERLFLVELSTEARGGEYGIGSGDCLVGTLVEQLSREAPVPSALRYATACGLANTFTPGSGFFDLNLVEHFLSCVTVTPVP